MVAALQIDLVSLLGELPAHMMHMLERVDPANAQTLPSSRKDQSRGDGGRGCDEVDDLCTGANCSALQELHRCAELCNLLSIVVANGPELKKPPPAGLDWAVLQVCWLQHEEPVLDGLMHL